MFIRKSIPAAVISVAIATGALGFDSREAAADSADMIKVSDTQVRSLKIKTVETQWAGEETVALLPATVVPAMNARIAATAPFAGTVLQVHALPGQIVKKGDALVTLASRDLLTAMGELSEAEASLQLAEAAARRERILVKKKIKSAVVADTADAQVEKIQTVIRQHKAMISLGGIKIGKGGTYILQATTAGKVVETHVLPGAKLDAMAPAISLDISNEVWLEAQVSARLASRIRADDKVQVAGGPEGSVVTIAGTLDEKTRSAKMLARLPADSGLMTGQMVTISITKPAQAGSLQVPAAAVTWIGKSYAVFVRETTGFSVKPVKLLGRNQRVATIAGALRPGQHIASNGLPQLELLMVSN